MKKGLVIFDLDGTLTDSAPGVTNCVQYVVEKCGRGPLSKEELMSFVGPPMAYQVKLMFDMDEKETEEVVQAFRERYRTHGLYENSVFPGIFEMLDTLKAEGYMLSVATAKPVPTAKKVLERFDLEKYFEHWNGAKDDDGRADKMDIIEKTLKDCGYDKDRDRAFLVGDRKFDAQGASLCGIGFFGAGWGYAPKGELEEYPNLGIAGSPEELCGMVINHNH